MEDENNIHWLKCKANTMTIDKIAIDVITKTLVKLQVTIELHLSMLTETFTQSEQKEGRYWNIIAISDKATIQKINKIHKNTRDKHNLVNTLAHKITKRIQKEIWKQRCMQINRNKNSGSKRESRERNRNKKTKSEEEEENSRREENKVGNKEKTRSYT